MQRSVLMKSLLHVCDADSNNSMGTVAIRLVECTAKKYYRISVAIEALLRNIGKQKEQIDSNDLI